MIVGVQTFLMTMESIVDVIDAESLGLTFIVVIISTGKAYEKLAHLTFENNRYDIDMIR